MEVWRRALTASLADATADLTVRQMAVLLTVYLTPAPHTVRGLARTLNLSKPVITRALDRLAAMGLVRRARDEKDRRSIYVQRTVHGSVLLHDHGERIVHASRAAPEG